MLTLHFSKLYKGTIERVNSLQQTTLNMEESDLNFEIEQGSDISDFDIYVHAALCEAELQQLEPSTNVVWDNQISDQILYEYAANYDDPPHVEDTSTSDSQEGKI